MTTLIAFTATHPRPVAAAIHHLTRVHGIRRIPMPGTPGYRLARASAQPGPGVLAVLVHDHQAAAVRAAGGTVVHLVHPGSTTQLPVAPGDEILEITDDAALRERLDAVLVPRHRNATLPAAA